MKEYRIGSYIGEIKKSIHIYFPPGVAKLVIKRDAPLFQKTLYKLDPEYILNHIKILVEYGVCDVILDYELNEMLNYNQRYAFLCNISWELEKFKNIILNDEKEIIYNVKNSISSVLNLLISLESSPGDFGQCIDFSKMILPEDFGLKEVE